MPEPRHISAVLREQFAAVGSPTRLDIGRIQLGAWLSVNQAAARDGRRQPTGDVLIGVGSAREVDAILAAAKMQPDGGPFGVLYSPAPADSVEVLPLSEIEARGRAALTRGVADGEPYLFDVGNREHCEREATRLRRIRAGHRSQEDRA